MQTNSLFGRWHSLAASLHANASRRASTAEAMGKLMRNTVIRLGKVENSGLTDSSSVHFACFASARSPLFRFSSRVSPFYHSARSADVKYLSPRQSKQRVELPSSSSFSVSFRVFSRFAFVGSRCAATCRLAIVNFPTRHDF